MKNPLEGQYLYSEGEVVLSLEEYQSYAYGLPESATVPSLLTRWGAGESVEARELLACFRSEALGAAASSDESLQVVRLAIERLEAICATHGAPSADADMGEA